MIVYLCCIARFENKYIRDFVSYYKKIGFDKIILCDNNFDGEEHFEDVIQDYIEDGFVIIENYRNKERPQVQAYYDCFEKYKDEFTWMAFFDVDEFLTLPMHSTVKEYLSQEKFNRFSAIHLNWQTYGDCGKVHYEDVPVYERFKEPLASDVRSINGLKMNTHVKTILRSWTRLEFSDCPNPHTPTVIDGLVCNEHGVEIENSHVNENYDYSEAYLRHYTTKTAEEYVKKISLGCPDFERSRTSIYSQFFALNKWTKEKDNILKNKLYEYKANDYVLEIIYFATGDYIKYLGRFVDSLPNFAPSVKKKLRIVTNKPEAVNIDTPPADVIDVEVIKVFDLFYPCVNLHKTYFIQQMNHDGVDAIFYFDADTVFLNVPEYNWEDFLSLMIDDGYFSISMHPFFSLSDSDKYKVRDINNLFTGMTERNPNSSACIDAERYTYVISSFFAARTDIMLGMCRKVNNMILEDMTRNKGYHIPLYIDENYFNKIVYNCEYNIDREFSIKVGMFIRLGNSVNDYYPEAFLMQKNMNKEFKTSRR